MVSQVCRSQYFLQEQPGSQHGEVPENVPQFFRIVDAIRQKAVKAYGVEQAQERQEEKKIGKIYENQGEEGAVVR